MKNLLLALLFLPVVGYSQVTSIDSVTNQPLNAVTNALVGNGSKNIVFGVYAQIDYNQPLERNVKNNGDLDIHRFVSFLGYKFSDKVTFVSEIEVEHVSELYVEQAFLNYNFNTALNFKAGLLLIPMGIVNEYHEPTTFNGVERPGMDSKIIPTTWRELGAGISGNFSELSLKYQMYLVSGFNGYDGEAKLNGSNGFRSGRQKGAKAYVSSPNLTAKLDYYGVPGLKIGLASYWGATQSTLLDGLDVTNDVMMTTADSSVVNIFMTGVDFRYRNRGLSLRGQFINTNIQNSYNYNIFTGSDLGSQMQGYYLEAGYDLIKLLQIKSNKRLDIFTRYENYNVQYKMEYEQPANNANHYKDITTGLSFHVAQGAVLKMDYQLLKRGDSELAKQLNFGVGVWF